MNECQHKGCQNRAERTIWPDTGPSIRLCEGHAQRAFDDAFRDRYYEAVWREKLEARS